MQSTTLRCHIKCYNLTNAQNNWFLSHRIWHKVSKKTDFQCLATLWYLMLQNMKTMLATTASASVLVRCLNIIEYYYNTFEISLNIMKVNWILVKEELCLIASHLSLGVRVVGAINAEKTQLLVNKVKIPTKEFFLWTLPVDQGINDGKRNGRQQSFVAWVFFWVEHSKARLTNGDNGHVNAWVVQCSTMKMWMSMATLLISKAIPQY